MCPALCRVRRGPAHGRDRTSTSAERASPSGASADRGAAWTPASLRWRAATATGPIPENLAAGWTLALPGTGVHRHTGRTGAFGHALCGAAAAATHGCLSRRAGHRCRSRNALHDTGIRAVPVRLLPGRTGHGCRGGNTFHDAGIPPVPVRLLAGRARREGPGGGRRWLARNCGGDPVGGISPAVRGQQAERENACARRCDRPCVAACSHAGILLLPILTSGRTVARWPSRHVCGCCRSRSAGLL